MDWYRQWRRDQRAGIHYHPILMFRPVTEGSKGEWKMSDELIQMLSNDERKPKFGDKVRRAKP